MIYQEQENDSADDFLKRSAEESVPEGGGNENRGNSRNPMPFSACEAEKGNEKQRNPRISLPLK